MGRVFVGEQFASGFREEIGEVKEPEMDELNPLELQAGRGEKVGEQRYGVPTDMVKHLSTRSMETFRRLSEGWHRFLELSSNGRGKQQFDSQQNQDQKVCLCRDYSLLLLILYPGTGMIFIFIYLYLHRLLLLILYPGTGLIFIFVHLYLHCLLILIPYPGTRLTLCPCVYAYTSYNF